MPSCCVLQLQSRPGDRTRMHPSLSINSLFWLSLDRYRKALEALSWDSVLPSRRTGSEHGCPPPGKSLFDPGWSLPDSAGQKPHAPDPRAVCWSSEGQLNSANSVSCFLRLSVRPVEANFGYLSEAKLVQSSPCAPRTAFSNHLALPAFAAPE